MRKLPACLALGSALAAAGAVLVSQGGSSRRDAPARPSGASVAARVKHVPASTHVRHCIVRPSACGYPDRTNTGVPAGTRLASRTGVIKVTTPGRTIAGLALTGAIEVNADNTTIRDDDITVKGTQKGCSSPCGGRGIFIAPGIKNTVIEDVTCHGGAARGDDVAEFCIVSNDASSVINRVRAYYCTTCFIGPATWENSFVNLNGSIPKDHYEDIYYGGGSQSITIRHNTLLNPPHDQGDTATIFLSVDFGDQRRVVVTDNLLAGGGWVLYGGANGSKGSVLGPVTYSGNRVSRVFYKNGGSYGIGSFFKESVTRWSHNYWDETLKAIPTP